jgi:NADP-dependent 3-hydroxy acid dehydrogenase YdfG
VVLVTGATAGVGQALAHQLAQAGAVTLIAARDRAKGARVQDEITKATGLPAEPSPMASDDVTGDACGRSPKS